MGEALPYSGEEGHTAGWCCILVASLLPGHFPSSFLSAQEKRECLIQLSAILQNGVGQLS